MGWTKEISGVASVGKSTKQLLRTIKPKQIAVIRHENIDEMAANGLIEAKVKAVINASLTMNGRYPACGADILLKADIPIFEIAEVDFEHFHHGDPIKISELAIVTPAGEVAYRRFTRERWKRMNALAQQNLGSELSDFIDNTLTYAQKEKDFVIDDLQLPYIKTSMLGRHVVVVVRGSGYKKDLIALNDYIQDYRPVLIGVDGGADALLENGFQPDLIVGDMDSVSDQALKCGAELLVHAYADGEAPGLHRIHKLGLEAATIPAKGTSEDIAMLLAFQKKAELIVTLGAHTHMIDFLEKGRKGMASTLLVRMKIGNKLVDAKGVSKLYHRPVKMRNLWYLPVAALFPLAMLGYIHPGFRHFLDMIRIYIKLSLS
ncbi:putative cytokinetic ring protein SteA [Marinicrinis lubricantis]|uniref:Cytokinetic ring protein SteA n=1 Tax=Marinicrinis lubricantis TaxID=2086470 RepID=A0ABW1ISF4_9BACL